jgi:hypothetical protein
VAAAKAVSSVWGRLAGEGDEGRERGGVQSGAEQRRRVFLFSLFLPLPCFLMRWQWTVLPRGGRVKQMGDQSCWGREIACVKHMICHARIACKQWGGVHPGIS